MNERVKLPDNCSENCMKMVIQAIRTNDYLKEEQKQMLLEEYNRDYALKKLSKDIRDIIKKEKEEEEGMLSLHKRRKKVD